MLYFDEDGYPTEEVLKHISTVRLDQSHKEMLDLVKNMWYYPDFVKVYEEEGDTYYRFATGGWSGNESLVNALQQNLLFWGMCWEMSKKGGVHVFKLKPLPHK